MKASTVDLLALGERMKAAREALGLSQKAFHEQFGYGSVRTYQKNEAGYNEAGIGLAESFVRAGINANWLLTGEGPMLIAGLIQAAPAPQKINGDALAAIIDGILKAQPNYSADEVARHAVIWYESFMARGLITPDGIGDGGIGAAA